MFCFTAAIKKPLGTLTFIMLLGIFICSCQNNAKVALDGPLLAVLCKDEQGKKWKGVLTPSAVYLIDLNTQTVAQKIITRSPAYSLCASKNGKLYTSNSGGLGKEVDHVIGVIDPYRGQLERYVKLEIIPGDLVCAGNDIFVTSGRYFPKTDETTWNKIDISNYKITTFRVPGVSSIPIHHDNKIYFSTIIEVKNSKYLKENQPDHIVSLNEFAPDCIPPSEKDYIDSLLVIDPISLKIKSIIDREAYFNGNMHFDEKGNAFALRSSREGVSLSKDVLVFFRPEQRQLIKAVSLPEQPLPAWKMVYHGDRVYISYYGSNSKKGDTIIVYDIKNLQPIKIMKGFKGPIDMVATNDALFVLCNNNSNKENGEIFIIDPNKLEISKKICVGKNPMRLVYVPKREHDQ